MGIKEETLKLLEEGDKTISQMAYRLKYNENSIRTIINRDLKPEKTIVETNTYFHKYKIYTLNNPENQYRHLINILDYREGNYGRIYAGFRRVETWYNLVKEFKEKWEADLKYFPNKEIRKNVIKRTKQLNRLLPHKKLVNSYLIEYKNNLKELKQQYKKMMEAKKNNKNFQMDLELMFEKDSALEEIILNFIKWEKNTKKFFEKLKTK